MKNTSILGIIIMGFLQLHPCNFMQTAVQLQMQNGYIAGWIK